MFRRVILVLVIGLLVPFSSISLSHAKISSNLLATNTNEVNVYISRYSRLKFKAEKGDADAQYKLAQLYYSPRRGSGFTKNPKAAFNYFRKAALQGHKDAQFNAGVMLNNGEGVEKKDKAKSLAWIKLAAENGHSNAKSIYAKLAAKRKPEELAAMHVELAKIQAEMKGEPEGDKAKIDA